MANYYFSNSVRFPHETIDGETVLIDSKKGHLYLFTGIGPGLWQRFIDGATIDAVVGELTSRYGEQADEPTRRFLGNMVDAELLLSRAPAAATATPIREVPWPETFSAPVMERYDEISSIISMDPIHEVDETRGWPHQPEPSA